MAGQAGAQAAQDSGGKQGATPAAKRAPPMSPHLQVWRWHVTMAASILTRATGVALYVGVLIVAGWALSLASGPDAYAGFMGLMASPLGKLVLLGLSVSIFYHLAAGIRHLVFDTGRGFTPKTASMSAWLCIAFALVATFLVWAYAIATGAA